MAASDVITRKPVSDFDWFDYKNIRINGRLTACTQAVVTLRMKKGKLNVRAPIAQAYPLFWFG